MQVKVHIVHDQGMVYKWVPYIDTGASGTTISSKLVKELKIRKNIDDLPIVVGFDGKISNLVEGTCNLRLRILDEYIIVRAIIVNCDDCNLMGMDVLTKIPSEIYKFKGKTRFKFTKAKKSYKLYAKEPTTVQPRSIKKIEIKEINGKEDLMITAIEDKTRFVTPNGVIDPTRRNFIYVINTDQKKLKIQEGEQLADGWELQHAVDTGDLRKANDIIPEEQFVRLIEDKLKHAKEPFKSELRECLIKHQDVFDVRNQHIGKFKGQQIDINPTNKKINIQAEKRRNYPPPVWDAANKELQVLWQNDLIEKSPHAAIPPANIVLVKRKGSSRARLCMDYRRLNLAIDDCYHNMPSMEAITAKIGNFEVLSNLDVANAYWQFEIKYKDRDLTSFWSESEVLRWKRLPFGIKSGAQWTQKLIGAQILGPQLTEQLGENSVVSLFIDDILLTGDKKNHVKDLELMLKCIKDSGIILKWEKSNFMKTEIPYLGVILKAPGIIKADPKFAEAMDTIKTPENVKEMRMLLGMFNWRSDFIDHFYDKTAKLYEFLKGKTSKSVEKIKLEQVHLDIIEKLKQEAKIHTSLTIPNFQKDAPQFEIEVDASEVGYGACLRQGKGIIAYASKSLVPAAKQYENAHREAGGLIWALNKFSKFIMFAPKKIKVLTDNKVVSFLKSAKAPKLVRWRNMISNYDVDIVHREGSKMLISDCLSRMVQEKNPILDKVLDKMQGEIVIAKIEVSDRVKKACEILHYHNIEGHCSTLQLKKLMPELATVELIKSVLDNCYHCMIKKPPINMEQIHNQILPVKDLKKNQIWYMDIVFPKIQQTKATVITVLDKATRFTMAERIMNRSHNNIKEALRKIQTRCGKPTKIISDREFNSLTIERYCKEQQIELDMLPRNTPKNNLVERKHRELKKILNLNPSYDLTEATECLNRMPLSVTLSNNRHIVPSVLFHKNNEGTIAELHEVLNKQAEMRKEKMIERRGKNVARFTRTFKLNGIVKYRGLKDRYSIRLGKVTNVLKQKYIIVKELVTNKEFKLHADEVQELNQLSYEQALRLVKRHRPIG